MDKSIDKTQAKLTISKEQYWDKPWSLVQGCSPVSPGCLHCWSAAEANIRQHQKNPIIRDQYAGLTHKVNGIPTFNGTVRPRWDRLEIPLKTKKPTVFAVWTDLFHEGMPNSFIASALAVMCDARCEKHTFLILTKRPGRWPQFMEWYGEAARGAPSFLGRLPDNVWIIPTAENQEQADKRIPIALQIPAAHHGVSIEPTLGAVDFNAIPSFDIPGDSEAGRCWHYDAPWDEYIDLVILGFETGSHARPGHPDWVRKVRDDCAAAGVPFFFKGWGEWIPSMEYANMHHLGQHGRINAPWKYIRPDGRVTDDFMDIDSGTLYGIVHIGRKKAGRLLDGIEHNDLPWRKT
jgi:protein gp37